MSREGISLTLKIHQLLKENLILPDLQSQNRDAVLRELDAFIKAARKDIAGIDIYEQLLQREKLGSTAVREGYAIPHCKVKGIDIPVVSLAVSKTGIHFESLDGKPSLIFFVVVTSADHPGLNIQILAGLAQLIRKSRHLMKKILHAGTGREILDIIREEEEKLL